MSSDKPDMRPVAMPAGGPSSGTTPPVSPHHIAIAPTVPHLDSSPIKTRTDTARVTD
ncbi:hypothetical protein GCM10012287_20520 [Streptomyces daqingensis]|uniref:Uncharacterized protein n=1 Tax=Streptomyces daqingensis TaxID=1472640 RepID=A0ABQ2M736_9ACTN|nr:hypothetical protein GCM10012287_20520 [Streptomyces daqingensis]